MERIKSTKNIGKLDGTLLLFGGVYSNFQSLEKMMEIAQEQKIPSCNIICTGDIVAYCAQPEETLQAVKEWSIHAIAGNVEIQLREGLEDCGCDFRDGSRCDIFSRQWYPYAQKKLSTSSVDWMLDLPDFLTFEFYGKKCTVVHGSFQETSGYIFASTNWETKASIFKETNSDIIIGGHCGLPFSESKNGKTWLNPGVIGMPANDGTSRVWFMILEKLNGEIVARHYSYEYDHQLASNLMTKNKLPQEYAKTLLSGIWDNCEILPEKESKNQGVPIVLDKKII